ncbi:hydrolase [Kangiella sp. HD9-110m-PIT-SAG07]|nr:hydrolase [Kangiella sp. HD9-110m-PIT-SAG07]
MTLGMIALMALSPSTLAANENGLSSIDIPKVDAKVKVDGILDEPFWQSATKVVYRYETDPSQNTAPKVKTVAYIAENGDSLLVAIKAFDPDPSSILASYKKRDQIWGEDTVGFKVDTFNDERKAYNFFVNALGIQADSIEDDVLRREDSSWDAIWSSAGHIDNDGYTVEIELPFKVLRFPSSDGTKTWGIDFMRFYPRDVEYRLAYSARDRDLSCSLCQIAKAKGLDGILSGNNLEVTPYVAMDKTEFRNPPSQNQWQGDGVNYNAGADLRWGVTENSVLNATLNPDFSQVETDAAQLDVNNRFSLFFPEKRPFFLDGAEYFNTRYNLLHTRNISDPDYGIKYTGKNGGHSYGVLASRDQSTSFIIPGAQRSSVYTLTDSNSGDVESNVAAARYSVDVGESSQLGFLATNRSADGYENTVLSVDGSQKLYDSGTLRYQLMYSDSDNTDDMQQQFGLDPSTTGRGFEVNYSHSDNHWNWYATRSDFDDDFRTDLGFLGVVGNTKDVVGAGYRWYGDDNAFFHEYKISGEFKERHLTSGQKYEQQREVGFQLKGKYQSFFFFGSANRDTLFEQIWFDEQFHWMDASFRPIGNLQLGFYVETADTIDFRETRAGESETFRVYADWQVNDHWFLGFNTRNTDFTINDQPLFDAVISNLNTSYHFDDKSYLRLIVRYSDIDYNTAFYSNPDQVEKELRVSRQLLYTYKWNPRTAFYIGYSDNGFEDNRVSQFEKTGRTIFTKFSYAFQL